MRKTRPVPGRAVRRRTSLPTARCSTNGDGRVLALLALCIVLPAAASGGCTRAPASPPRPRTVQAGERGLLAQVSCRPRRTPPRGESALIRIGLVDRGGAQRLALPPVLLVGPGAAAAPASGEGAAVIVPVSGPTTVSVFARERQWRLFVDGAAGPGRVFELPFEVGAAEVVLRPARRLPLSLRLQRLGAIYFSDSFTEHERSGAWEALSGCWRLKGMAFSEHAMNPFCLASGESRDRLAPGRTEPDELGIGARFSFATLRPVVVRVSGDSPAAEAGIEIGDTVLLVNGQDASAPETEAQFEALFRPFGEPNTLRIRKSYGGEIVARVVRLRRRWGDPQRVIPFPAPAGSAVSGGERVNLIVTGETFWRDYAAGASVRMPLRGAAGLALYVRGAEDFFVFRWAGERPADANRLELIEVSGGRERVLAARDGMPPPGQWFRMAVAANGGRIRAYVDGRAVLEAESDRLCSGRAGLYSVGGEEVVFDDVAVASEVGELQGGAPEVPRAVALDATMRHWASEEDDWLCDAASVWWHRLPWPGDLRIRWPRSTTGMTFLLGCTSEDPASGYMLRVEPALGQLALCRGRETLGVRPLSSSSAEGVEVIQDGRELSVRAGGERTETFRLPEALPGERFGLIGPLAAIDLKALELASTRVRTESFTEAPTGWMTLGGRWGSVNRWICDPRWSYFGGVGDDLVAVRTKDAFKGPLRVEGFVAPMMLSPTPPFERFEDLFVSVMARPEAPASGYTVGYRPEGRRRLVLYRDGREVASSVDERLFFPMTNYDEQFVHRRWQAFRFEVRGGEVAFMLDGVEVFRWHDREPLEAGHVALWTVRNGLLLARLRMTFGDLAPAPASIPAPVRGWRPFVDERLTNLVDGTATVSVARTGPDEAPEYRVENAAGAGPFSVVLRPEIVSTARSGGLSFQFAAEPGVSVDLYFDAGGRHYRYVLTGPGPSPAGYKEFGRALGVKADGRWHDVAVDFSPLAAAGAEFVLGLRIANLSNADLMLGGATANRLGSAYRIRKISFLSHPEPKPEK